MSSAPTATATTARGITAEERKVIFASSLEAVCWFGGLLPTTAFALVAYKGDIYYGLWYPIAIAAFTFVIGMLFIKETKDNDIYAND